MNYDNADKVISERIKELRLHWQLTQIDMCAKLHINGSHLSRLEANLVPADLRILQNLYNLYNISLDRFLNVKVPIAEVQVDNLDKLNPDYIKELEQKITNQEIEIKFLTTLLQEIQNNEAK